MLFRKKSKSAAAPPPVVVAMTPDGEPDMRAIGRALWQKRITILGFTLISAVAAFVIVNAITPRYRSESRLLLEARENVFLRAAADKTTTDRNTIDPEAVASQTQVLLSRDLAREVIAKEKLTDVPEFQRGALSLGGLLGLIGIGRDRSSMSREERTMEAYYDRLNVQAIEKSRVIAIDFSSANADLAARVANGIAAIYLKMQQTAQQNQTRAAGAWLAGEIDKMRKKVAEAEDKVEQYRTKTNLFVGPNNTSLPSQQLTEINSQIAAARGRKADLEARARQLRDLIRSGGSIATSDIANSETMRRLIEQRIALRNQLAEQSTTLLSRHPRIKELKAQIAEADRQIRAEGERLARQLDNDAKVASDRIQTLTASFNQVKKLASQSNTQDVELRALEREAKTQRDLLEILSRKIPRSLRPRQHQCRAAGCAHHFARHARHQAGLSEETADGVDRRLCRLRAVGGLYRHRGAAGAGRHALWLRRLCARGRRRGCFRSAADAAHGLAAVDADAVAHAVCRRRAAAFAGQQHRKDRP